MNSPAHKHQDLAAIQFVLDHAPQRHVVVVCSQVMTVHQMKSILDRIPGLHVRTLTLAEGAAARETAVNAESGVTIGTVGVLYAGLRFHPSTALCCVDATGLATAQQLASRVCSDSPLLLLATAGHRTHRIQHRDVLADLIDTEFRALKGEA